MKSQLVRALAGCRRFAVASLVAAVCGSVFGATLEVGSDKAYADIASAVKAASDGDTVLVDDGDYTINEGLSIATGVTVKSRSGAAKTKLFTAKEITLATLSNAKAVLSGFTLASDYTMRSMKAVSLSNGATCDGCTIRNFKTSTALIYLGAAAVLTNSVVTGNYVEGRTELISAYGRSAKLVDMKIHGNTCKNDTYGSAVYIAEYYTTFRNCQISCNTNLSSGTGAIGNYGGGYPATFENCTIADNVVVGSATTPGVVANASTTFRNCIIHNNRNKGGVLNVSGNTSGVTYCAIDPVVGDETKHNILPTSDTFNPDYTLKLGAWVDGGTSLDWQADAKDLAGNARVSGSAVDMGCYEYSQDVPIRCAATPSVWAAIGARDVTIAAQVVGTDLSGLKYSFTVKNLAGDTVYTAADVSTSSVTHRFDVGFYLITLTVANDKGGSDTWTATEPFKILPETVYVAKASTPVAPYGTLDTAAHDLETALGVCQDGMTVVVDDGVYTNNTATVLTKGITIRSRNGADRTTLFTGTAITVFTLNHAQARVENLTLASDYVSRNASAFYLTAAGSTVSGCTIRNFKTGTTFITLLGSTVLTNCVITGNYVDGRNNLVAINGASPKIVDTKVVGNSGNNNTYGCAVYLWNNSALFRNCLICCNTNNSSAYSGFSNHGSYSATLENCTIADNVVKASATAAGVRLSKAVTMKNCIVYNNRNTSGVANFSGDTGGIGYSATEPVVGDDSMHNVLATADTLGDGYRLGMGPWVDGGTSLDWQAGAKDLAGNDRVSGEGVDMGAYEYVQDGSLKCAATPSVYTGLGEQDVTLSACVVGTNRTGLVYSYVVKDASGNVVYSAADSTEPTVTHRFGTGSYEITVSVKNSAKETDTWTGKERFTILPDTVYVSHKSTPAYPYGDWNTAANDLATALAACSDGMTVIVDDGVYTNDTATTLANNITIRSRNGADGTTFFTAKAITFFTLNNAGARLKDLTLASDSTRRGVCALDLQSGTFEGCTIRGFSTSTSLVSIRTAVMTNATITGNAVSDRNNLVVVNAANAKFVNVKIVGNTGNNDTYGCAIWLWDGDNALFRDCLIACNTNNSTGHSAFSDHYGARSATFENCTIADNCVAGSASAAGLHINSKVKFTNCIIHNNRNTSDVLNFPTDADTSGITYSATEPLIGDESAHNVLATSTIFGTDYSLGIGSWIDGGTALDWHEGAKDLAGNDRVQANAVDMGCYEAEPIPLSCSVTLAKTSRVGEGSFTISATVLGSDGNDIDCAWTVSNRVTGAVVRESARNELDFTRDYSYGLYSVRLEIAQNGESASARLEDAFTVYPPQVRVNPSSTPAFPYDGEENAFNDIAEAVAFAQDGMRVLVADGVYTNAAKTAVTHALTVESEHGAERTAIFSARPGETECRLYNDDCVFRGFTFLSDYVNRSSCALSAEKGTVADCVIRNFNCAGSPVTIVGGVLTNCTVTGCRITGRTFFMRVENGQILDSRIVDNVCAADYYASVLYTLGTALVRNTLIAENRVSGLGGENGIAITSDGGSFVNCTVACNTSSATTSRPAVYRASYNSASAKNCIFWNNATAAGEVTYGTTSGTMVFENCLSADASVAGADCLVGDPCFSRPGRGNYRLHRLSPAIDAGYDGSWNGAPLAGAVDLRGQPRLSGKHIDIGCYEWRLNGFLLLVR